MRHAVLPTLGLGCLIALLAADFGPVLFQNQQFAYRDAGHYYYPLYQRVQQEWEAGRWPLWADEENGGAPLLGNSSAAVLYPGKLIYAVVPYAWGARLYIVAHLVLAFGGMVALLRSWGTSGVGSVVAGLGYAFGAPVLFLHSNVIFLVGAAWMPLGFRAADRRLRLGSRWALLELALILAMQVLGGDPESACVLVLCATGYALGLVWRGGLAWKPGYVALAVVAGWVVGILALARWLPEVRAWPIFEADWSWLPPRWTLVLLAWGIVGVALVRRQVSIRGLAGLASACALAASLTAAQLLPAIEYNRMSVRASEDSPLDIDPFSLEPYRLIELAWPNVFGTMAPENHSWLLSLPPLADHQIWTPSLYLGGLVLVLAIGGAGLRGGPPWRPWLTAVAVVGLLASFGKFGGPIWLARCIPSLVPSLGPHDPPGFARNRGDGFLGDGFGSVYGLIATVVPGFDSFRYPSKLLSVTSLALAGLAGLGWDRIATGRCRRAKRLALGLLGLSMAFLVAVTLARGPIVTALTHAPRASSLFGPLDPRQALADLQRALLQGGVLFSLTFGLAISAARRPRLAGPMALVILTADLALANSGLVWTVPQADLESVPEALRVIQAAERDDPANGPYRVHRLSFGGPDAWSRTTSPDRLREIVRWERDTLDAKHGLPFGIDKTLDEGTIELYDYLWFFRPAPRRIDAAMARNLGAIPGQVVVYYPRRGFDLWNTRYVILPIVPHGWKDPGRGYASFLPHSELIYPKFDDPRLQDDWVKSRDWQVLRNKAAFPRAWVVHDARAVKPIVGLRAADRVAPMKAMLFQNDPLWNDPERRVHDFASIAWIETEQPSRFLKELPRTPPEASEAVTIVTNEPRRVELTATLNRPGLVILADVFYPGWRLTIDGADSPILRANRLMRGAEVAGGRHRLVYTYEPESFRIGGIISLSALAVLLGLAVWATRRPSRIDRVWTGPRS